MNKLTSLLVLLFLGFASLHAVEVQMVAPANGSVNVPVDTDIIAVFDQPISAQNLSNIHISPEVENLSAMVEGARLVIYHNDLKANTTYTITIPFGVVVNYEHAKLTWSFTTGNYADAGLIEK